MSRYRYSKDLDLEPDIDDDIEDSDDDELVRGYRTATGAVGSASAFGLHDDRGRYQLTEEDEDQLLGSDADSLTDAPQAGPSATATASTSASKLVDNDILDRPDDENFNDADNGIVDNDVDAIVVGVDIDEDDDDDILQITAEDAGGVDDSLEPQPSQQQQHRQQQPPPPPPVIQSGASIGAKRKSSSPMPALAPPPRMQQQSQTSLDSTELAKNGILTIRRAPDPPAVVVKPAPPPVSIAQPATAQAVSTVAAPVGVSRQQSQPADQKFIVINDEEDDDYQRRYEEHKEKQARIRRMIQNQKEHNRLTRLGVAVPPPKQPPPPSAPSKPQPTQPPAQAKPQQQQQLNNSNRTVPTVGGSKPAGVPIAAAAGSAVRPQLQQRNQPRPLLQQPLMGQARQQFAARPGSLLMTGPARPIGAGGNHNQQQQYPAHMRHQNPQLFQQAPFQQPQQLLMQQFPQGQPSFSHNLPMTSTAAAATVVAAAAAAAVSAGVAHGRRSVRIVNCPPGIAANDLKVYTELVGPVHSCQVYSNNGQAYITFCFAQHAQEFVQRFHRANLKGHQLQLSLC